MTYFHKFHQVHNLGLPRLVQYISQGTLRLNRKLKYEIDDLKIDEFPMIAPRQ